nr:LOW QUALITY PROTEIN: putative glycerol kinase 5 [Danaus plexippus plexippus]
MGEKYILSLDIGTSTIRSVIYNTKTEILGKAVDQVTLHYPSPGFVEIDPDELWKSVVGVVNKSLQNANLSANQITAMGISDSYTWKFIKISAYVLFMISRSKRFRAGSVFKFSNNQVSDFICNRIHMTDVSSASATGFFDPYTMQWAGWAMAIFGIPMEALPEVVDTAGEHFTSTAPDIWGHAIPIRSCIADQTASMWGSCCFSPGDVKLTMGTGTFLNIHTGASPHTSLTGLYPVVGWRMGDELVFSAEGANNDTASIIKWAQNLGLFDNPQETADIAMSVPDSDGVFFIPAFSGLGPPYNDFSFGIISNTSSHQSLISNTNLLSNTKSTLDGGVSNNDFLSQLVADLTGLTVERPVQVEMSSLGCAHIVGLQLGIFTSKEQLKSLRKVGKLFTPRAHVKKSYEPIIEKWEDAVKRMCGWYNNDRTTQSNTQNNLKVKLKKQGKSK